MVIVPDSKIKLIKNPLKLDNNNEMMFDSATAQYNYFTSLPKLEFNNLTYVRKDGVLRVETDSTLTYEDLLEYNFCMYQNTHFDSKWFYAFITEVKWINPSLTELKLETAYYQTWQFDLTFMDSFIEREHVNDDGIGKNTIEEGISTGEYISNSRQLIKFFNKTYYLPVIGVTELIDSEGNTGIPDVYEVHGRIMNGVRYITAENVSNISTLLRAYDALGKADAVQFMFMAPKELWGSSFHAVDVNFTKDGTTYAFRYYKLDSFDYVSGGNQDILRPTNLDGYYPKNRKLFNFPYCYLTLDSHDGNIQQFNFEDFEYPNIYDDDPTFRKIELDYTGILTPGCSIKYIPKNYKKGAGYLYSFPAMKTPMCSWVSDPYTNWLTQQAINTPFGTIDRKTGAGIASTLGVLVGAGLMATGHEYAGFKLLAGGFSGAFSNMQSDYQAQLQPNQAKGNLNSGDINFSLDLLNPEANVMTIKYDRAKSIDDFLSMYGYKVNRVGKPHLHIRAYYDYCKTNEANIEGNIPEEDLNEIRKMFNNGIRFWHNTTKYLDFTVNNAIISPPTPPVPPPSPETTIIDTSITVSDVDSSKTSYINLFGNTSQDGNPTPDNPVDINVATGNIIVQISNYDNTSQTIHPINLGSIELCKIGTYQDKILKSTGKNIFNEDSISYNDWSGTIGTSTYTDTITNAGKLANGTPIPVEGGEYYIMTWTNPAGVIINEFNLYCYDNNGVLIDKFTSSGNSFGNNVARQMPINTAYINISSFGSYSQSQLNGIASTLMIEKSQTSTSYEPYGIVWYVHKEIGKTTDTIGSNSKTINDMVSNASVYSYCGGNVSGKTITYASSLVVANTIYYPLATTIGTKITDSTLISQLNELYTANLFSRTSRIISYTNDLNPYIKLHYNI